MATDFPTSPTNGQLFTSSNGNVYYWDSSKTAWRARPQSLAPATVGEVPPSNPISGSLWYNSADGNLYVYYSDSNSSQWVQIRTDMSFTSTIGPAVDSLKLRSPNYIINGAFDFWQRGTSFTQTAAQAYTADRWLNNAGSGGLTVSVTRQSFAPGELNVGGVEGSYFARINRTAAGAQSYLEHRIEDVHTLAGRTATLSFYAKASAAYTFDAGNIYLYQNFGTGGSTGVSTNLGAITLSTSWQRFSLTATLPSISGKTVSATDSLLDVVFSSPAAKGTFTIDLWGVQLEEGAVGTPFRRNANSIQGELAACQRYYTRLVGSSAYSVFGSGLSTSTTNTYALVNLPVSMRTVPTIGSDFSNICALNGMSNSAPATALTTVNYSPDGNSARAIVTATYPAWGSANQPMFIGTYGNATPQYIGFSAEL